MYAVKVCEKTSPLFVTKYGVLFLICHSGYKRTYINHHTVM